MDIGFKVEMSIECFSWDGAPEEFSIKKDSRFRVLFNNQYHPAIVLEGCQILPGETGVAVVEFVALSEEKPLIKNGLKMRLYGGVKAFIGRGVVLKVL
ncbi:hypothetical protein [Alcanivorax sp.]|jgi:hypothetical protein|uniref:hypothetical protein n=1 Tax=Alcanivorax sp. TaxID=1872427 RepID=UPI0025BD1949|nr:hypothetical protein [Alcanivorax sp.]